MELHGTLTSPYVRHVRVALLETGLPCEFVDTPAERSAEQSPTKKVPFLRDGELLLSDSTAILKYLREKVSGSFLATVKETELYCTASTAMDAAINVFYLEKGGVVASQAPYLERQTARVTSAMKYLEGWSLPTTLSGSPPLSDGELRLACFLDWGLYRYRIDLSSFPRLAAFLELAHQHPSFEETAPPVHLR